MPTSSPTTAVVTAAVTSFHKIGGTHSFSKAQVTLTTPAPGVTQAGVNQPIVVTGDAGGSFCIHFVLTDQTGGKKATTFVPVGIGFKGGSGDDPNGLATFPMRVVADVDGVTQLTIEDVIGPNTSFEFGLVIQDANDGALGLIDPMLTNQTK